MNEIETQIKEYINLKDRKYTYVKEINGEQKTIEATIPAEQRPNMIARTETLRIANEGLIRTYQDNGIKKVSWLAAISERTCETCMALDGQIMTNEQYLSQRNQIHPFCRCSALAIQE